MDSADPHINISKYVHLLVSDYEKEYPNWQAIKNRKERIATYQEFLTKHRRNVTFYETRIACKEGHQEGHEKGKCCGLHNGWYFDTIAPREFEHDVLICDYCYQENCECWKVLEKGMYDEYEKIKHPVGNPNLAQMNRDRAKPPEAIEPIIAMLEGNIKTRQNHPEVGCRRKADQLIKGAGRKYWDRLPGELQARLLEIYAEQWPE